MEADVQHKLQRSQTMDCVETLVMGDLKTKRDNSTIITLPGSTACCTHQNHMAMIPRWHKPKKWKLKYLVQAFSTPQQF